MRFPNCLVCADDGVEYPAVSDPRVEAGACLAHAVCKCGWPAYCDSSQTPHEAGRPCAAYHRQLRLDSLQAQRERGLAVWTIQPMAGNLQVTEPPPPEPPRAVSTGAVDVWLPPRKPTKGGGD